jgi:hypothetical protein
MMDFLRWVEELRVSTWIREGADIKGYATILFLHTIGMATVVGCILAMNLRLLGVMPQAPVKPLERLYPLMWWGFVLNALTGTLLLMADATTKLTNYDFYVKMALIAIGLIVQQRMRKTVFHSPQLDQGVLPSNAKALAWASMICWLGAITAGRLLAYLGPVAGLA